MNFSRRNFIKKATATGAAILAAPAVFGTSVAMKPQKAATLIELKQHFESKSVKGEIVIIVEGNKKTK